MRGGDRAETLEQNSECLSNQVWATDDWSVSQGLLEVVWSIQKESKLTEMVPLGSPGHPRKGREEEMFC